MIGLIVVSIVTGMFKRTDDARPTLSSGNGTVPARLYEDQVREQQHHGELLLAILDEQKKTRSGITSMARAVHRLARAWEAHAEATIRISPESVARAAVKEAKYMQSAAAQATEEGPGGT